MTENDLKYWKQALSGVVPKELITPEVVALRDQQNKMLNLMAKKNADYGNAFNKGCDKLGYKYGLARMFDKANRLIHLIEDDFNGYNNPNVKDESMFDTIQDLANYCNMLLAWTNKDEIVATASSNVDNKDNKVYYEIYQYIHNGNCILVNDKGKIVTREIIDSYNLDNLCKDNAGYVYSQNADGNYVSVTDKEQSLVTIISKDDYSKISNKKEMML